jgi:hypothetical protein
MASFTGPAFHSARWDHSVDLRGKRVAVVGTGKQLDTVSNPGFITVFDTKFDCLVYHGRPGVLDAPLSGPEGEARGSGGHR